MAITNVAHDGDYASMEPRCITCRRRKSQVLQRNWSLVVHAFGASVMKGTEGTVCVVTSGVDVDDDAIECGERSPFRSREKSTPSPSRSKRGGDRSTTSFSPSSVLAPLKTLKPVVPRVLRLLINSFGLHKLSLPAPSWR